MTGTRQRTVSREVWEASQVAWQRGDFSDEWREWRHLAAMAGIIDPPEGTKWDSWEDHPPTQRALLVRAIRETPEALRRALTTSRPRGWGDVISQVIGWREDRVGEARAAERHPAYDPSPREAAAVWSRLGMVADANDRARVVEAVRSGKCPTCGQPMPRTES